MIIRLRFRCVLHRSLAEAVTDESQECRAKQHPRRRLRNVNIRRDLQGETDKLQAHGISSFDKDVIDTDGAWNYPQRIAGLEGALERGSAGALLLDDLEVQDVADYRRRRGIKRR